MFRQWSQATCSENPYLHWKCWDFGGKPFSFTFLVDFSITLTFVQRLLRIDFREYTTFRQLYIYSCHHVFIDFSSKKGHFETSNLFPWFYKISLIWYLSKVSHFPDSDGSPILFEKSMKPAGVWEISDTFNRKITSACFTLILYLLIVMAPSPG